MANDYVWVRRELDAEDDDQTKQFRISIDPRYLIEQDHFDCVKAILNDVFAQEKVNIKIAKFDSFGDILDIDGTMNSRGLDRDQRGKEVCIYLSSEVGEGAVQHVKALMLETWKRLQEAEVPLMTFTPSGDKPILLEHFPTPFSYTFTTRDKEWLDRHCILFKDCEGNADCAHPNHALHHIRFTDVDIKQAGVSFDRAQIAEDHIAYLEAHFEEARQAFKDSVDSLTSAKANFSEIDIDTLFENILKIRESYSERLKGINKNPEAEDICERRGALNDSVKKEVNDIEDMALFISAFPCDATQPALAACYVKGLQEGTIIFQDKEDILQLRDDLKQILNEEISTLKNEFKKFKPHSHLAEIDSDNLKTIVRANPLEAQKLYRRLVLLNHEAHYLEREKLACVYPTYEKCTQAINDYLHERPKTLGFFSRYFDNKRGLKRAQTFQNLFNKYQNEPSKLDLVIYCLLASENGIYLKENMAKSLGYDSVNKARQDYKIKVGKELGAEFKAELDKDVIKPIVKATNHKKAFDDKSILMAINKFKALWDDSVESTHYEDTDDEVNNEEGCTGENFKL